MAKGNFIEYVISDDPNKYPNESEQDGYYYRKVTKVETEEQTITAGITPIEVIPSQGKLINKVTVNPTPTESKEVTAGTEDITVSPSEGKYLDSVTVHPTPTEEKTVDYGTIELTNTSSAVIVKHSLGVIPTNVFLMKLEISNSYANMCFNEVCVFPTSNSDAKLYINPKNIRKTDTQIRFECNDSNNVGYIFDKGVYLWMAIV